MTGLRFWCVLALSTGVLYAQQPAPEMVFKRITKEVGLPSSKVSVITQTRDGFMWLGTRDGYCRYDSNRAILAFQPAGGVASPNDDVRAICEDRLGNFWLGTFGGGMFWFDRVDRKLTQYKHDPRNINTISDDRVLSIIEDRNGTLWIATVNGLNSFDRNTASFTRYYHSDETPGSLSENRVWPLLETRTGEIWVGTIGGGINRFNPSTGTFTHFLEDKFRNITSFYQDRSGTIWIGTENHGMLEYGRTIDEFERVKETMNQHLQGETVYAIAEGPQGEIYAGTANGGVKVLDNKTGIVTTIAHDPSNPHSLSENNIRALYVDRAGMLWVGTESGGACASIKEELRRPRRVRKGW